MADPSSNDSQSLLLAIDHRQQNKQRGQIFKAGLEEQLAVCRHREPVILTVWGACRRLKSGSDMAVSALQVAMNEVRLSDPGIMRTLMNDASKGQSRSVGH
jgi:hypothetical protein